MRKRERHVIAALLCFVRGCSSKQLVVDKKRGLKADALQNCKRPMSDVGKATLVGGLSQMLALVAAMTKEWEVAVHNATLAQYAQQQVELPCLNTVCHG